MAHKLEKIEKGRYRYSGILIYKSDSTPSGKWGHWRSIAAPKYGMSPRGESRADIMNEIDNLLDK